jgi:hypothetical protein
MVPLDVSVVVGLVLLLILKNLNLTFVKENLLSDDFDSAQSLHITKTVFIQPSVSGVMGVFILQSGQDFSEQLFDGVPGGKVFVHSAEVDWVFSFDILLGESDGFLGSGLQIPCRIFKSLDSLVSEQLSIQSSNQVPSLTPSSS